MGGMTPSPGVKDEKTTGTGGTGGTDNPDPPKRSRQRGRPSQMDKVESRLNEMFSTIAIAQAGLGVATQDPRHLVGGDVTAKLAPDLVRAWVKLADENPRVRAVLLRMSETSAWGEVILATGGLIYSQAQVYGALPPTMPNPWVTDMPVPPSPDVAAAYAEPPSPDWQPPSGRQPPRSGVDAVDAARQEAERQREAAEAQRLRQRADGVPRG